MISQLHYLFRYRKICIGSLVFGMGQLSEEGIAKKIAEQISVIAFKAPRLLHMEKEFTLLREAALRAYRQEYPNREHFLNKY